jgi:uncharacterized protein YbjQ (UPF0145 family)
MENIIGLGIGAGLLLLGYLVGHLREKSHLESLARREALMLGIRLDTCRVPRGADPSVPAALVTGEAVIASDTFKTWTASLRNIFGGEARNMTRLFQRARREATLRLLESAQTAGFDAVCNLRYDGADVGGSAVMPQKKSQVMACCAATGTAYRRQA